MSIVDAGGNVKATYKYDPYGNLVSSEPAANSIGAINPIRYRGYYYDTDSQLYYLQSRYYDPELGRFLNADAFASTGQGIIGTNMFAYCLNNPVMLCDASGSLAKAVVPGSDYSTWWASVMWILCCIDGALPIGDIIYAAGCLGIALVCGTTLSGSEAESEVLTMAVGAGNDDETIYTVYFLYAVDDPNRVIIYVGRVKTENYAARMRYHATRERAPSARIDGLTYEECRYVEQAGMIYFHTIGRGEPYKNQIRGISPTNRSRHIYISKGRQLTGARLPNNWIFPESYLANLTENNLLNGGM